MITLELDSLGLVDKSAEQDQTYLKSTLIIAGVMFHVEAFAVHSDEISDGIATLINPDYEESLEGLVHLAGTFALHQIEHNGMRYILCIYPYGQ